MAIFTPYIKEEDKKKILRASLYISRTKKTNEFHIPGITKVKFYDVTDTEKTVKVLKEYFPNNQIETIVNRAHRFKPGTNGTVVLILDYNLKNS